MGSPARQGHMVGARNSQRCSFPRRGHEKSSEFWEEDPPRQIVRHLRAERKRTARRSREQKVEGQGGLRRQQRQR